MYTHGLPAPQVLQQTQIRRAVLRRADRRHVVRAVVAEPPAADELVQLSSKVTKDIRGERRKYNFAAGPGCLPKSVLETAQEELLNYNGAGVSVMEMSHRSKEFIDICDRAEKDLRELLGISDAYEVLFLQGGASAQFAAVPLNLTAEGNTVDHIVTGAWSKKAAEEARKYCTVNVAAKGDNVSVPPRSSWQLRPDATYVHYCDNETIQGVEFKAVPDVGDALLIADMSSNFCSKPVDVSKYGIIYAGAQKNVGPAGLTIVIVRKDLLDRARPSTPTMLHYKTLLGSMYNTPPCWSIYMAGLVFAKLLREGGLDAVRQRNEAKAQVVYDAIAGSGDFYNSPVDPAVRSLMNIPFTIPSKPELEKTFISEAAARGLMELKGHRSVGGMRASVYNAMPPEGAQALATFMKEFAEQHA